MSTFIRRLTFTPADDQAYTEDFVLVYKIILENAIQNIQLKHALNYFKKYGQVLSGNVFLQNIYIKFADSKVAAKVLRKKIHLINNHPIVVRAARSFEQPYRFKDAEANDIETEQPSCSNRSFRESEASIQMLNNDCLEFIFKILNIGDQINFSQTSRQLSDVFIMLSKVQCKMLQLERMLELTLFQKLLFLKRIGHNVESLKGRLYWKDHELVTELIGRYCTNAKRVSIERTELKPTFLHNLINKMYWCIELGLQDVALNDNSVEIIKCLPNLKILRLEDNCGLTGKHICDLHNLEELSLNGSRCIQSFYFRKIYKNLTNLHTLDIRSCMLLTSFNIKEMAQHLHKLEDLKMSRIVGHFEYIAQLPKLKRLEISNINEYFPLSHQLLKELVKYKSEQLEELVLMGQKSLNFQKASFIGDLKKLKKLHCGNNLLLDDKCLEKLAQLSDLEDIDLQNCINITNQGLIKLLQNCPKLNCINVSCCSSITQSFVYDAFKLLKAQEKQTQRKGPVLLLAYRTNINGDEINTPTFQSSSDLMKVSMEECSIFGDSLQYFDNTDNFSELNIFFEDHGLFQYNLNSCLYRNILM